MKYSKGHTCIYTRHSNKTMESFRSVFGSVRQFSTSVVSHSRAYESVVNRQLKTPHDLQVGDVRPNKLWIPKEVSKYPAYPYGEARIFKRSDRGLYGGQVISFGNKISEMGNRNRRTWLPNVIVKSMWSSALNRIIKLKLTARVLRTITKEGGLDNYLTKDKEARIKELGLFGWKLRYDVMRAKSLAARPPQFETVKKDDGSEVRVYYNGAYQGNNLQLTIGKRKLLRVLYPVVQLNTVEPLSFTDFNMERSTKSVAEILVECEKFNLDLSAFSL